VSLLLPPNVSEQNLAKALEAFAAAIGSEHVLTSDEDKTEYRDPFWFKGWDDYEAAAVLQPATVGEIQAIVRIANERRVPLWVSSVGRNNGYGGSSPRVRGSVVVNLRRMNKVLEIDEQLGYAVIEPGVRWFDLYDAIQAGGHKLRLSVADLGWGSVVGNTLDHGITYLPYGQDQMMQCGMEVVLPDGTLMRTGNWAIPNGKAAHVYKRGLGPTPDQLFMQSNFGIVTKMGVWLMPTPECYMPCWLRVWNDSDLPQVVDALRELMLAKDIEGVPQVMNTLLIAAALTPEGRSKWYDGDDPMPDDVIDRVAREMGVGRWLMRFGIYGHEEIVDARFKRIQQAFARIAGAEVWGTKYGSDEYDRIEHPAEMVEIGIPNMGLNTMTGWYSVADGEAGGGHVAFSPAVPMTGNSATQIVRLLRDRIEQKANLDYVAALLPINARCFIHITMVFFNPQDEEQARGAYETCKLLVREAGEQGYGEYRAHLDFMDLAASQYSFNDNAYRRFCETIKDALDPNGILMPGRHSIWPRSMRQAPSGPNGP
jgi:4-cresol dehydrogenase (hydroxylating)